MMVEIQSEQLGTLEIPESEIIHFPSGLPGFPHAKKFCLLQVKPDSKFQLLQSTENSDLAFVVMDPLLIAPDYPMDNLKDSVEGAGTIEDRQIAVAVIVTISREEQRASVNLLAPIVMGVTSQKGMQIILHDSEYSVRHQL